MKDNEDRAFFECYACRTVFLLWRPAKRWEAMNPHRLAPCCRMYLPQALAAAS